MVQIEKRGKQVIGNMTNPASAPYGEATRDRILLEASRLFARWGYHGTSTRDIARSVGIQQPSLFHHFPTKRAIMEALLKLNFQRAVEYAVAVLATEGSAGARLYRVLRSDLSNVSQIPFDLSGTQGDDILRDPEFENWGKKQKRLHKVWRSLVEEGIREGSFVAYDSGLVQLTIEGVFKEVIRTAARHSAEDDVPSPDELARFMLRALLIDPTDVDSIAIEADRLEQADSITL